MHQIIGRRKFLATAGTAAAAAAAASGVGTIARAAGAGGAHASALDTAAPSTLDQRVVLASGSGYRPLVFGPGEPFLVREDLAIAANPARTATRQSVVFFAHHSDTHILDAQSPARFDTGEVLWALGTGDGFRPQETMTTQVADAMVRAANQQATSPVTGAAQRFAVVTGDVTDSCTASEVRWFVDLLDGGTVEPNSGTPGHYEGPQTFPESDFAYHPDNPALGPGYAQHGFPAYKGLLEAAVQPFQAAGSAVPWYMVFGNHDVIWVGSFANLWVRDLMAAGDIRASRLEAFAPTLLLSGIPEGPFRDLVRQGWEQGRWGARRVSANPVGRRRVKPGEFVAELFDTAQQPGPVGHGFTQSNLTDSTTWWSRTDGPVHYIGFDSTNHFRGASGGVTATQWAWLQTELAANADKLVVLFSHHNSETMDNFDVDPAKPERIYSGGELVELLLAHRNVVAWVNGHIHANRIIGHRRKSGDGGFWEVTAASCIDFPQQSRMIELVDNHDGTLSLFTYVLDHASDPAPGTGSGYTPAKLASISRELSANDPFRYSAFEGSVPTDAAGKPEDRNVELLLADPFA